jgi:hypothetical protein
MITAVLRENRGRIKALISSEAQDGYYQCGGHTYEYDRLKMDIIFRLVAIGMSLSDAGEILSQLGIH